MLQISRCRFYSHQSAAATTLKNQTKLLMRYPAKLETYSTIASCTSPNNSENHHINIYHHSSSSSSSFVNKLHIDTIKILKSSSNPSGENITRICSQLTSSLKSISHSEMKQLSVRDTVVLLSLCYQTGVAPTEQLLSRCESLVPQLMNAANGSPQYLMQVICCYEFFAPHRLGSVLESARKSIENAAQSLRASELAILICQYCNFEVFTASRSNIIGDSNTRNKMDELFYETILERAVMICNDFSAHEISQISLALAQLGCVATTADNNNNNSNKLHDDIRDALHHELSQRFIHQQELTTLRDAAGMLYSVAIAELDEAPKVLSLLKKDSNNKSTIENKDNDDDDMINKNINGGDEDVMTTQTKTSPLVRELSEACARRLYLMLRDTDADTFAKILSSLSKISLQTPRLVEDLGEISTKLDFGNLHPVAALDCLSSAAEMGLNREIHSSSSSYDALFGRLTATMMSGKGEILRNDQAREKLLGLVVMLK